MKTRPGLQSVNFALTSLVAAALVIGFGNKPISGQDMVPDFALLDVNETSQTYDQLVSPRDYLQQVSAWYFGHAT